ncbi:hypothetical protein [Streptomyces sp. NPDC058457]|uniref:hypothetical protein n=1 Tax=Streptomyces sp. NPDC058457 TaxID=3346507 RepID=UPI0036682AD2
MTMPTFQLPETLRVGRPMRGWIVVAGSSVAEDDDVLGEWIDEGRAFAASLPPK